MRIVISQVIAFCISFFFIYILYYVPTFFKLWVYKKDWKVKKKNNFFCSLPHLPAERRPVCGRFSPRSRPAPSPAAWPVAALRSDTPFPERTARRASPAAGLSRSAPSPLPAPRTTHRRPATAARASAAGRLCSRRWSSLRSSERTER